MKKEVKENLVSSLYKENVKKKRGKLLKVYEVYEKLHIPSALQFAKMLIQYRQ